MDDWLLWLFVMALLSVFTWLMVKWAREAAQQQANIERHLNEWVRTPSNPTDNAYEAWLAEQGLPEGFPREALEKITYAHLQEYKKPGFGIDTKTWPYEPEAGYDERKEGA